MRVLIASFRDGLQRNALATRNNFGYLYNVTRFLPTLDAATAFEFLFGFGRKMSLNVLVSGMGLSYFAVRAADGRRRKAGRPMNRPLMESMRDLS